MLQGEAMQVHYQNIDGNSYSPNISFSRSSYSTLTPNASENNLYRLFKVIKNGLSSNSTDAPVSLMRAHEVIAHLSEEEIKLLLAPIEAGLVDRKSVIRMNVAATSESVTIRVKDLLHVFAAVMKEQDSESIWNYEGVPQRLIDAALQLTESNYDTIVSTSSAQYTSICEPDNELLIESPKECDEELSVPIVVRAERQATKILPFDLHSFLKRHVFFCLSLTGVLVLVTIIVPVVLLVNRTDHETVLPTITSGHDLKNESHVTTEYFSQDLSIFLALSPRASEADYHKVQTMTTKWIREECDAETNGSVMVFMPRTEVAADCKWSNTNQCITQLMNTPIDTVRMNASEIVEHDTDFAADVLIYVRKLLFEKEKSKHHVILLVTDFVSLHLADDIFYFIESKKEHDLMVNVVVVLDQDNPNALNRSRVLELYSNLITVAAAKIETPTSFDGLIDIFPALTPCKSNATLPSHPWNSTMGNAETHTTPATTTERVPYI